MIRAKSSRWRREGRQVIDSVLPHQRRAAHYATDRAIKAAKRTTRTTIRGVGLGRLSNAVGATSSLEKGRTAREAWGAVYARGGINSRANQALMAYTQGARILPTAGRKWLAFPTKAAGRLVRLPIPRIGGRSFGNFKNQPSRNRYRLRFVQFSSKSAGLFLDDVSVSKKTGRAKPMGKRLGRGSERKRSVLMFRLIRFTTRAKRFDQHQIVRNEGRNIGRYVEDYGRRNPIR